MSDLKLISDFVREVIAICFAVFWALTSSQDIRSQPALWCNRLIYALLAIWLVILVVRGLAA